MEYRGGSFKLVENVRLYAFIFSSMNTHQVSVIKVLVIDGVLSCVADSLQDRCFASISPTDYKDTKASKSCSKIIAIKWHWHDSNCCLADSCDSHLFSHFGATLSTMIPHTMTLSAH